MLRDMAYAGKFMNEFSDRIMFGTDICYHDQVIRQPEILYTLRDNGSITQEMFDNIARRNAYRLLNIDK